MLKLARTTLAPALAPQVSRIWPGVARPKRQTTLRNRGLDFADAELIFAGPTFTFQDDREDYGERRWVTLGLLRGKVLVIVHTERLKLRFGSCQCVRQIKMSKSSSSITSEDQDDYRKITQADLNRATFRVGLKPAPRKRRVTILLDTGVVEYFKAQAGERGYHPLINETLRQAVERDDLGERLRRLIIAVIKRRRTQTVTQPSVGA